MLDVALSVDRPRFRVEAAFEVGPGERFGLYGPSGSGKSTVLEAIAGLVPVRSAQVRVDGRDVAGLPAWQRRIGLVRQRPALFPHLSVLENVRYGVPGPPRRDQGGVDDVAAERALCERLGIAELLGAYPSQLSGGQAQRVALARALRAPAQALLLDEPFQGLDPPLRAELSRLVRDEAALRALPVVLVAHELGELQAFAGHIGVLAAGRVLQVATPGELVRRPASVAVARLVGYPAVVPVGSRGETVGIHPDLCRIGAFPDLGPVLSGIVRAVVPAGLRVAAEVELAGELVALVCEAPPADPGRAIEVTAVDPPRFGPDGVLRSWQAASPAACWPEPALP